MIAKQLVCAGAATAMAALLSPACGSTVSTTGAGGHVTTTSATTSTSTSTSAGGGKICGGLGTPCAAGEYCHFPDGTCKGTSVCVPQSASCDTTFGPICGCDGQVHDDQCAANGAGVDVSANGGCKAPPGQFGCASFFCALGSQYCEELGGQGLTSYSCKPLPASCGAAPSCACLSLPMCVCTPTSDGGFQLACNESGSSSSGG